MAATKTAAQKAQEAKKKAAANSSTSSAASTSAPATTGSTDSSTGKATTDRARTLPTYKLGEPLDELPESVVPVGQGRGRSDQYVTLLRPIVADESRHGKWVLGAEFKTPTGAREAEKPIEKGERNMPAGVWETAVVKVNAPEVGQGETAHVHNIWSRLYFRYLGPNGELADTAEATG